MARSDAVKVRGLRRGEAIAPRLVRTMPESRRGAPSLSMKSSSRAEHFGLAAMAVAALVTVTFSVGTISPGSNNIKSTPSVGYQSFFASPGSKGGISIKKQSWPSQEPAGRVLQEEDDVVDTTVVEYTTQLQLYMCNPSLDLEGSDAYEVDETRLAAALGKISGLGQADTDEITVTIKTEPDDDDDDEYMCDNDGMLQWHAQINYGPHDPAMFEDTPAVMAAQANDYVAYSSQDFKALLAANINNYESGETLEITADDIVVPTLGWIVIFPSEAIPLDTGKMSSTQGLAMELVGASGLWNWWMWLILLLLVACCLIPLCCLLGRPHDNKSDESEPLDTTRQGRKGEGLDKIRGPEWGITELDFEANYNMYQDEDMKREYDGAGKSIQPTAYRASRPGHQSVGNQAWMQEAGKKSAWSPPSKNPRRQAGGGSPVRRFDIDDDEDADDQGDARLRSKHAQSSFDIHAGAGRGGLRGSNGRI